VARVQTLVSEYSECGRLWLVGHCRGGQVESLCRCGVAEMCRNNQFFPEELTGDPFRPFVTRRGIDEVGERFDLIRSEYSFGHIAERQGARKASSELIVLACWSIRMSAAGRYPWRTYRAEWVKLGASRYLTVRSELSLRPLARCCGLEGTEVGRDSTAFQLWGGRTLRGGRFLAGRLLVDRIALMDPLTPIGRRRQHRTAELDAAGDGDREMFLLDAPE